MSLQVNKTVRCRKMWGGRSVKDASSGLTCSSSPAPPPWRCSSRVCNDGVQRKERYVLELLFAAWAELFQPDPLLVVISVT